MVKKEPEIEVEGLLLNMDRKLNVILAQQRDIERKVVQCETTLDNARW